MLPTADAPDSRVAYAIDLVAFTGEGMVIVEYADPARETPIVAETTRLEYLFGADEDIDERVQTVLEDLSDLIATIQERKRNPPARIPGR